MEPLGNDRWRGRFVVTEVGRYEYAVAAWTDASQQPPAVDGSGVRARRLYPSLTD